MHVCGTGCSRTRCSVGCKVQTADFKSPTLTYKVPDLVVCKGLKVSEILSDFYPVLWLINENNTVFSSLIYKQETILVLCNSQYKPDGIKNDNIYPSASLHFKSTVPNRENRARSQSSVLVRENGFKRKICIFLLRLFRVCAKSVLEYLSSLTKQQSYKTLLKKPL